MPESQGENVLTVIDDTLAILKLDDDERRIAKIYKISSEAEECTKETSIKAATLTQGLGASTHVERRLALEKQRQALQQAVKKLDEDSRVAEQLIESLRRDGDKLLQSKDQQSSLERELPLSKVLALYANVCKTKWDFDAMTVKGAIINKQKSDTRPFEFDAASSQFAITNALWDLMDA